MNIYKLKWVRAQVNMGADGVWDDLHHSWNHTYQRKPKRLCKYCSRGRRLNSSSDRGQTQRSVWKTLSPTCRKHYSGRFYWDLNSKSDKIGKHWNQNFDEILLKRIYDGLLVNFIYIYLNLFSLISWWIYGVHESSNIFPTRIFMGLFYLANNLLCAAV